MFLKNIPLLEESEESEENEAGWLVTFADAMSLLLAFFVLLISFSSFETSAVSQSIRSVSKHLGGGARSGSRIIKTSHRVSKEELELSKKLIGVKLSDLPIPYDVSERPIDLHINKYQKINEIKKLLKENPALLSVLIQKKTPTPLKKLNIEEEEEGETILDPTMKHFALSLQNLQHYIVAEGMQNVIAIERKPNGDVSFEIDCAALFQEGIDKLKAESELLLRRIAKLLKIIPNKIAIENFATKAFDKDTELIQRWVLTLSRSEQLVRYFTTMEDDITEDRFSILAQGYKDEKWEKIQKVNLAGEGVMGITILAFNE